VPEAQFLTSSGSFYTVDSESGAIYLTGTNGETTQVGADGELFNDNARLISEQLINIDPEVAADPDFAQELAYLLNKENYSRWRRERQSQENGATEKEAEPAEEELPIEEEAEPSEEELPIEEKNISHENQENASISVINASMPAETSDIRSLLRFEGFADEKPLKEILVSSVPFVFGAAVRFRPNAEAGEPLVPADNVVVSVLKEKDDPYFKG